MKNIPSTKASNKMATLKVRRPNRTKIEEGSLVLQIKRILDGIPAREVTSLVAELGLSKSRFYEALGYPRTTVDRQISLNKRLSPEHSERFLAVGSLVELAERIVAESDNPKGFNAVAWLGQWLEQPQPALDGRRPSDFLDTYVGIEVVRNLMLVSS